MMGINGHGRKGWRPLQSGIKQPLFCEDCEQHFNERFEKPFKRMWVDSPALPAVWPHQDIVCVHVDYAAFKLFHLSILFRASVSTLPTFSAVSLGRHEEEIRKLLLTVSPGKEWQYPIMGIVLFHHRTRQPIQFVSAPIYTRFRGLRCYGVVYGGVQWWVAISSHRNADWVGAGLTPHGDLPLGGMPWTEAAIVRQASQALHGAGG